MGYLRRCALVALVFLSGCSIFHTKTEVATDTVGSLLLKTDAPLEVPLAPIQLPLPHVTATPSHEEIVANYQKVLTLAKDPLIIVNLQQRLAELEMLKSERLESEVGDSNTGQMGSMQFENNTASAPVAEPHADSAPVDDSNVTMAKVNNAELAQTIENQYGDTIAAYVALLEMYPERTDNDEILYQLSKAYELDTQIEEAVAALTQLTENFPNSPYWLEAQFRIAEFLFSDIQYARAEQAYLSVVDRDITSTFYKNSLYMLGWSRFKQEKFDSSLDAFITLLDFRFDGATPPASVDPATQQQLNDVLRVMSWIFSERGGAPAINDLLAITGARPYEHLLFSRLASEYLKKSRYIDAADTYQAYIVKYPGNGYAAIYFGLKVRYLDLS